MNANNHYAAFLHLRVFKVIQPFHVKPFTDTFIRPEPGHTGFKQRHADRLEVFSDELLALLGIVLWKAKLNIFTRDGFATFQEIAGCAAQLRPQQTQNGVGKLNQQPENAKTKPGKPVTRV